MNSHISARFAQASRVNIKQTPNKHQTNNKQTKPLFILASSLVWECVMNKAIGAAEIDNSLELGIGENIQELAGGSHADDGMPSKNLSLLLRRLTELSTREIENLVDELHRLRKKLEGDGDRIQSEIARHSALSQGVMQLTTVVADNVKKLPQPAH